MSFSSLSSFNTDIFDSLDDDKQCVMPSTAVAIDKDKSSQHAMKWTLDHLADDAFVVLLHVKTSSQSQGNHQDGASQGLGYSRSHGRDQRTNNLDVTALFRPYRLFCAKKGVKVTDVVLENTDVAMALAQYITNNRIINIVLGASNRNAITRKFKHADVPTTLMKIAPDFCSVYVIWKDKPLSVRSAVSKLSPSVPVTPRIKRMSTSSTQHSLSEEFESNGSMRSSFSEHFKPQALEEKQPMQGNKEKLASKRPPIARSSSSMDSFSDDIDYSGSMPSSDFSESVSSSSFSNGSSEASSNSIAMDANRDLESEMRRLRLELKQTMEMYNSACKEAVTTRQKTSKEINMWKADEIRRPEEATMAMVETEKAKCSAAQATQRLTELEAHKRRTTEMMDDKEADEKKRAIESIGYKDLMYRRYDIGEIEIATDYFSNSLKIGEGGYGPVFKAKLDHTLVAIKILRPDAAAQGKKQFQQEVEVLSCIRHPNMVLLLGACPEYGCLVYEYMDNGSLDDRLFRRNNTPPLPWRLRFSIALEITTALHFLHQTRPEPLVHRDLKPGNILLDRNFTSKISDVGLARLVPARSTSVSVTQCRLTSTAGTFCYIDPEYQQSGMLTTKSDVYSLGVLLLQLITGRMPMGLTHSVETAIENGTFVDILDPNIDDWPVEEAMVLAKLALRCAEMRRKDRPDLGTIVLSELQRLRDL